MLKIPYIVYVQVLVCTLMMQKLCAVGMSNAILTNHFKWHYYIVHTAGLYIKMSRLLAQVLSLYCTVPDIQCNYPIIRTLPTEGFANPRKLKNCMKLNWIFQRGDTGVLEKIPSVGEAWVFSGTTHCVKRLCMPRIINQRYH